MNLEAAAAAAQLFCTLDVQMTANQPEHPRTQANADREVAASFANWSGKPGATSSRQVAAAARVSGLDEDDKEQTTAASYAT